MKNLKLRVWDIEKKKMIYFHSLKYFNNYGFIAIGSGDIDSNEKCGYLDVDGGQKECIFLQFTGLKDSKGKDIYEGDIVATSNDGKDGCDKWNKKDFGNAECKITKEDGVVFIGEELNFSWEDEGNVYALQYLEIIGNIHENPNLIKK